MKVIDPTTCIVPLRWRLPKAGTDEGIAGWGDPVLEGRARGPLSRPCVRTPIECLAAPTWCATALGSVPALATGIGGPNAVRAVLPENREIHAVGGDGAGIPEDRARAHGFGTSSELFEPGPTPELGQRARALAEARDEAPDEGGRAHG